MKTYSFKDVYQSALKKGYKEGRSTKHKILILYVDGKKTNFWTKVSHGTSEIGKGVLVQMRKQMGFDQNVDFESYIDCHMSKEEYIGYLRQKGNNF